MKSQERVLRNGLGGKSEKRLEKQLLVAPIRRGSVGRIGEYFSPGVVFGCRTPLPGGGECTVYIFFIVAFDLL